MFSTIGLHAYFDRLGIPDRGRRIVEEARLNSPVRKVQSRLNNVITLIPSRKMGRMIATESRTGEYRAAMMLEYDENVLEYYAQPTFLDLRLTGKDGSIRGRIRYPPDFMVLTPEGIYFWEIREESRLIKLATDFPHRFRKENGIWRYQEVENHLGEMGLNFRLTASNEFPVRFLANTDFLADYLRFDTPPLSKEAEEAIKARLCERPEWPLQWLVDESTQEAAKGALPFTVDDIYKAVANQLLIFDMAREDISATRRVHVFRDRTTMELHRRFSNHPNVEDRTASLEARISDGALIDYGGQAYRVVIANPLHAILQDEEDPSRHHEVAMELLHESFHSGRIKIISPPDKPRSTGEHLAEYSPAALAEALKRLEAIENTSGDGNYEGPSKRSLRRYRKAIREAGDNPLSQVLALVPKHSEKGYRKQRIPIEVMDIIEKIVAEYNDPTGISPRAAFIKMRGACQLIGVTPCSERALRKILAKRKSVRLREGNRRAYQTAPTVWYLKADEPIHGIRPFQIVHIDHTEAELEIMDPETGKSLGRIWLSLAIDAESRRMVAFYASFRPPSYRSCMMILRDMVRRFGRLPDMIVVDNGKEFHSHSFVRLCNLFRIKLRYRPPAKARFGSVIERLFGTAQTQLIHQMEGNTKLMRHARSVTKSVMPANFVAWTLPAFAGALDYYFEHIYGALPHPAHGEAPVEHFNRRLIETGARMHCMVRYDEFFRVETCPSPEGKPTRRVDNQRGIKVEHIWYWNDVFRGHDGVEIEARKDPWDPGVAYAFFKGRWVQCISKYKRLLSDLTEEELRHHFDVLGKRHGIEPKDWSPEIIADWIKVLDPSSFDKRLTRQQAETRRVYEPLGMTRVSSLTEINPTPHIEPSTTPSLIDKLPASLGARVEGIPENTIYGSNPESQTEDDYETYDLL